MEYCKKRPFIEKPYHDIYGQTFVPDGPGRGKKKKDQIDPLKNLTPNGSQDGESPPSGEGPAKPIAFPHAKCHNCNTFLPIKRMNNHMVKCIGGGGRDSSRTALQRIQNGNNANGSQNGSTPPPGSRSGTPAPSQSSKDKPRNSPNKREADDEFDDESSPHKKPKKSLIKKTAATKHKAPKMAKSGSQQREASNLSFEEKAPASESEGDGSDDDDDGEYGTVVVEPKKKKVLKEANTKKLIKEKKKWLHGKGGVKPSLPPVEPPDVNKVKTKQRVTGDPSKTGAGMMNGRDESESSQTLSSPN